MLSRRNILARAAVPVLGVLPIQWKHSGPPEHPRRTRLILGGDVMLSRHVGRLARLHDDPAWSWRDIASVFQSADIGFVNLESPFSDRGDVVDAGMIFKAEPEMIEGLKLAGIDVVSTANNHARDQGGRGVEFTLDWLERNGIAAAGSGRSEAEAHAGVVIERNGLRFGFLAYTYDQSNGNHKDSDRRVARDGPGAYAGGRGATRGARGRGGGIDARGRGVQRVTERAAGGVRSRGHRCGRAGGGGASSARHATVGAVRQGRDLLLAGESGVRPVSAAGNAAGRAGGGGL